MPLNPVPVTRTKLAISYSIYVTAYNGKRHKVGTFKSLTSTESRNIDLAFTLDADLAGEPYETIPKIVDTKELRYSALTLYTQNLMEAIGDKGIRIESLSDFNIPFDTEMQVTAPDGSIRTKKFVNCWLVSYSETVDMKDIIVAADGSIRFERIDYTTTV